MTELVYDVPISEVASLLEKSDRQVRRYVKGRRLEAQPVRIQGHMKLMFNRDEVLTFRERLSEGGFFGDSGREIVVDAHLVEDEGSPESEPVVTFSDDSPEASAVKYVIDALREQITDLHKENRELHYQLEQRSGQVGFLQGKVEAIQEEMKMLMPASESREEIVKRKPWYRRLFGSADKE